MIDRSGCGLFSREAWFNMLLFPIKIKANPKTRTNLRNVISRSCATRKRQLRFEAFSFVDNKSRWIFSLEAPFLVCVTNRISLHSLPERKTSNIHVVYNLNHERIQAASNDESCVSNAYLFNNKSDIFKAVFRSSSSDSSRQSASLSQLPSWLGRYHLANVLGLNKKLKLLLFWLAFHAKIRSTKNTAKQFRDKKRFLWLLL